jgi:potassium-transporting ATPase KdpC subunit
MSALLRPTLVLLGLFTALTGLGYPLLVTGLGQAIFSRQANGSLVVDKGRVMGSALIGQPFDEDRYFWGRPSATAPFPYNAAASTGSNLGPSNPALREAIAGRVERLRKADPGNVAPVPPDLVTTSASGLDPHVSPEAALFQVRRVARARGLPEAEVRALVSARIQPRTLGLLGEPRVNVLQLNLALDGHR